MPLPDFSEFVNYRLPKKKRDAFDPELLKPDAHNTQDNAPEPDFDVSGSMYAQPRTEEYLQHLRERPIREDYPTSVGRKIGSGALKFLTGANFPSVENPKLNKARELWQDTGAGLKEGAQFEQKDVIQRRLRLADMLRQARSERNYGAKLLKIHTDSADRLRRIEMLDLPELERKKLRDAEYAKVQEDVKKHRDEVFQEGRYQGRARLGQGERRLKIAENRPIPSREQAGIDAAAHKEVAKDPRFGHWYNPKTNNFGHIYELDANGNEVVRNGVKSVKEQMPEELVPMLKQALASAAEKIATKHRSNYAADAMSDQELNDYLGWGDQMPDFLKDENP